MGEQETVFESLKRRSFDGRRLNEFIYGTVTGMVAIIGVDPYGGAGWLEAALIVIAGAVAIWIAHAYAELMSRRIASGGSLGSRELADALAVSWPIVSSGLILAAPFLGVALGIYKLGVALLVSSFVGVSILALVGLVAGVVTHESWSHRVFMVLLSCSLGVAVVLVELAVRH
jgi:hypothetical protein